MKRKLPPAGINGGGDGEPGRTEVRRLDGTIEELAGCVSPQCDH